MKYDDYVVSNVKDRVAVVFVGSPDGDNPHGQFAQAGQIRFKVAAARAAGARALLIVSDEDKLKDDRLSRLSYDNSGEAGIPVLLISKRLAQKILTLGTLEDYRAAADVRQVDTHVKRDKPTSSVAEIPRSLALRSSMVRLKLDFTVDVIRRESPSFNVVGILPGNDPKLKDEAIVIGAHYDHLGRGSEGSLAPREGEIHHGADDNASGIAGLLELARMLSTQPLKPRRSEPVSPHELAGFLAAGSVVRSYRREPGTFRRNSDEPLCQKEPGELMLIVVGARRIIDGENSAENMRTAALNEIGTSASPNIRVSLDPRATPTGAPIVVDINGQPIVTMDLPKLPPDFATPFTLTLNEDGYGPSDHSSFYSKQVPVLFFWTGTHNDYHKPSDTADKINYEGEARILVFIDRIIRDIDKSNKRPTYTVAKSDSQGRSTGFRVYLGTIPNYADSNDGLKLDGVRDDSPAAKAGLKAGDKVVKLAGREVKNVYDYTYALGEMKAGQEYEVEVIRDGQRLTLKITPEARK